MMTHLGVVSLDTIRLTLALCHCVRPRIQKLSIRRKAIAEVAMGGRGIIDDLLHGLPVPSPNDPEAQNVAGVPLDAGYKVGRLFFWETNANNSSSSKVSTALSFWRSWGRRGAGRLAAA